MRTPHTLGGLTIHALSRGTGRNTRLGIERAWAEEAHLWAGNYEHRVRVGDQLLERGRGPGGLSLCQQQDTWLEAVRWCGRTRGAYQPRTWAVPHGPARAGGSADGEGRV